MVIGSYGKDQTGKHKSENIIQKIQFGIYKSKNYTSEKTNRTSTNRKIQMGNTTRKIKPKRCKTENTIGKTQIGDYKAQNTTRKETNPKIQTRKYKSEITIQKI